MNKRTRVLLRTLVRHSTSDNTQSRVPYRTTTYKVVRWVRE